MIISALIQFDGHWLRLQNPIREITAVSPPNVLPALEQIETAVNQEHLTAVGFLSYEAAAAFGYTTHKKTDLPLLSFALFPPAEIEDLGTELPHPPPKKKIAANNWQASQTPDAYNAAIATIKSHIAQGNSYQVNYTFHLRQPFHDDPLAYFQQLAHAQQAAYMAYLDMGEYAICCASPELFFALDGDRLTSKPMKGTAVRGHTLAEDKAQRAWLSQSEKNRAENVMIVDMMRNDMGKIAQTGSVHVPHLFEIETYPTLLQMTSTVTAKTERPLSQIIAALFPCASITGAPKTRTMQLIHELESEARGVYTGSIGILAPQRKAQFNVAIRTVVIDKKRHTADYGVGSGIVWDSVAADEYAECRLKTAVLSKIRPAFHLLESLLWQAEEGYFLLAEHMARLRRSAEYFGIVMQETAVRQQLHTFEQSLKEACKIRVLLAQNGHLHIEAVPLTVGRLPQPLRIAIAQEAISSDTIWLYHKTTVRDVYEQARAARPAYDDIILWNEQGEITETSKANIVLSLDGKFLTPPVSSGLLAGTFREVLLQNGRIQEQKLTLPDLTRADDIFLINSVRRWQKAILIEYE